MATFYADENFNQKVVSHLESLGHDVVTAREAGQASQAKSDAEVLAYAVSMSSAVLTHNRRHFVKLHLRASNHCGIVICTDDRDYASLAQRIHDALMAQSSLNGNLLRVNKAP